MSNPKRQMSPIKCQNGATAKRPKTPGNKETALAPPLNPDVPVFADDFDFDFSTDDFDVAGFIAAETDKPKQLNLSIWQRCVVVALERDRCNYDLILQVRAENCQHKENNTTCRLQGPWSQTHIAVGNILSLQGVWDVQLNVFKVDKDFGFCVTNPDNLISGTSVVGSLFCQRKAVLQDRFRGIDASNKVMVIGSLVHELLQTVLGKGLTTEEGINAAARSLFGTRGTAHMLYSSKMKCEETELEVLNFLPSIYQFVRQYVLGQETSSVKVPQAERFEGCITKIEDIEDNFWVPQLGLKGKVDVSVQIHRRRNALNVESKQHAIPLELKTGRASFSAEHKGQVILYQMMLFAAGISETQSGLLLYLRDRIMREIPSGRNEQRDLIMLRNNLDHFLTQPVMLPAIDKPINMPKGKLIQPFELPQPISHHSACGNCAYATLCCAFAQTDATVQLSDAHPLRKVMPTVTAHLQPADYAYFIHWSGLLALEEQEARNTNFLRTLWTEVPQERWRKGRAVYGLNLECVRKLIEETRYIHTFVVPTEDEANMDLTMGGFSIGEYVIVSSSRRLAIAAGWISALTASSICINLERNLSRNYADQKFIVDKHLSQSGNVFNFTNLGLLLEDSERSAKLRAIVIQRDVPTFRKILPTKLDTDAAKIMDQLNPEQRRAVLKALHTDSFVLFKGLPGTGKTETLVALVRLLKLMCKSVLITSHTHSAVDNLMIRLKQHDMCDSMLRLGSFERTNSELFSISEHNLRTNSRSEAELSFNYASSSIVGVTCLGTAHSIFLHRRFDYCIVDEATQVLQATVLRPLFFCDRFVLVGDPDQLPPLIRSQEARKRGADESLFQRLDCAEASAVLTAQYRMNKTITKLANELTYGGKLQCATNEVKMATMRLKLDATVVEKWLQRTLQTHVDQSVFLLDTMDCFTRSFTFATSKCNNTCASLEGYFPEVEAKDSDAHQNPLPTTYLRVPKYANYCEAAIIFRILRTLLGAEYDASHIGIMAPYRAQVDLLGTLLDRHSAAYPSLKFNDIEINTVDQFQGRDKEIILYSCSNTGPPAGRNLERSRDAEILEDKRRLTVAITRAKYKLILIGDAACLQQYTPFHKLFARIPSYCRLRLEDGKLCFLWEKLMSELSVVILRK